MPHEMDFSTALVICSVILVVLIIYYVLLVRALREMMRLDARGIIIVFTYISLIPIPPLLILGILNLIIWHLVRKDLVKERGA